MIFVFLVVTLVYSGIRSLLIERKVKTVVIDIFYMIFLGCLIGFRDSSVGRDTLGYVKSFYSLAHQSYETAIKDKEWAYQCLTKLIADLTSNYTVYLTVYGMAFSVAYVILVSKESKDVFISYICIISLNYLAFAMAGIRQTMAMSILLMSFVFLKERKPIRFILLVIIAMQFHNTAVIFLLAYPAIYIKKGRGYKQIIFAFLGLVLATFFKNNVSWFLFEVLKWERIENYSKSTSTLSLSGFIIKASIFIFCTIFYGDNKDDKGKLILYNLTCLGVFFQAFTVYIAEFFRISMYFSIFETVLLARVLADYKGKEKIFILWGVVILLLVYYVFFGGINYIISPNVQVLFQK